MAELSGTDHLIVIRNQEREREREIRLNPKTDVHEVKGFLNQSLFKVPLQNTKVLEIKFPHTRSLFSFAYSFLIQYILSAASPLSVPTPCSPRSTLPL